MGDETKMSQFPAGRVRRRHARGPLLEERLDTVLARTIPSQHESSSRIRPPRIADAAAAAAAAALPPQPARLHRAGVLGFRRRQMDRGGQLRALASPRRRRSRPRSKRSSTSSRRRRRPTAISTAGTSAASPRTAGPTCATTTSSTTPATCWRAPSPISRPPAGAAGSTSWSATSTTSAQTFGPGPGPEARLLRPPGDRARR